MLEPPHVDTVAAAITDVVDALDPRGRSDRTARPRG